MYENENKKVKNFKKIRKNSLQNGFAVILYNYRLVLAQNQFDIDALIAQW